MIDLIGKRVRIEWADDGDWPNFILLGVDATHIRLQGVDDDEGNPYKGGAIWVAKGLAASVQEAPING